MPLYVEVTLRQLRNLCGKTQQQVAEKMHVTQQYVSNMELCGETDPKLIAAFVEALGGTYDGIACFDSWCVNISGVE